MSDYINVDKIIRETPDVYYLSHDEKVKYFMARFNGSNHENALKKIGVDGKNVWNNTKRDLLYV